MPKVKYMRTEFEMVCTITRYSNLWDHFQKEQKDRPGVYSKFISIPSDLARDRAICRMQGVDPDIKFPIPSIDQGMKAYFTENIEEIKKFYSHIGV